VNQNRLAPPLYWLCLSSEAIDNEECAVPQFIGVACLACLCATFFRSFDRAIYLIMAILPMETALFSTLPILMSFITRSLYGGEQIV
jgi:hypothetical protein